MHDARPAARPVAARPADDCNSSSYYSSSQGSYYSSSQEESYYSSSYYSESQENSPPQLNKKPAWIGVDTASIRPHVATEIDAMLLLAVSPPIDVTMQYVTKRRNKAAAGATAAAKRKAKGNAKAVPKRKSKTAGQTQRKTNSKVKARAKAVSKPDVGAPAAGSLAAPSSGAPARYGCSKCVYRPHGARCKTSKGVLKPDCIKLVKA